MHLRSLSFAGYRSFAARSPAAINRPLQELQLAPITVLMGKNNSGKSTVGKLLHHCLLSLSSQGQDPFPMDEKGAPRKYGSSFRDIQHERSFFNPLDFTIEATLPNDVALKIHSQLNQLGDKSDGTPPIVELQSINGRHLDANTKRDGLLPATNDFSVIRSTSKRILENSCYLGPIRDKVKSSYTSTSELGTETKPSDTTSVVSMLQHDLELRTRISEWMVQNLEGWKIDVQQVLEEIRIITRRGSRESNLADAGEGMQQVLPVITLYAWRSLKANHFPFIDIIEQPELHLHDAAHAALADLIISAAHPHPHGALITETHSEALILRLRRRIAEKAIPSSFVNIYYIEDAIEGSQLKRIKIDSLGEVDWWPDGVFSESLEEVKAIRKAQRQRSE